MIALLRKSAPLSIMAGVALGCGASQAATLFASGQKLTDAVPGVHDDIRENFVYSIDTTTGVATPISPSTTGLPPAMGATADGTVWGYRGGELGVVDPATGDFTPVAPGGPNATAFEIAENGTAYSAPFNADFDTQRLFRFDEATQNWEPLGGATEVGDAIDAARGAAPGTAEPFIISLGIVGAAAYGLDLDTDTLIAFDLLDGSADVVGAVGAAGSGALGAYSGFSALAGVDADGDGAFDSLFGSVNFWDDDNDPNTPVIRLGGVAKFDLTTGMWDLVGSNEGVIFFGMASAPAATPIPLPAGAWLLLSAMGAVAALRRFGARR